MRRQLKKVQVEFYRHAPQKNWILINEYSDKPLTTSVLDVNFASLSEKGREVKDGDIFMYLESGKRIEPTEWQRKIAAILETYWTATSDQFLWKHGHAYVSPADTLTDWGIQSTQHRFELINAEWNLWLKVFEFEWIRQYRKDYTSHFEGFRLSLLEWKIEELYYCCGNREAHKKQQEVWRIFAAKLEKGINPFRDTESTQNQHRFNLIATCLFLEKIHREDSFLHGVSNLSNDQFKQLKTFIFEGWKPYKKAIRNYLKTLRSGFDYQGESVKPLLPLEQGDLVVGRSRTTTYILKMQRERGNSGRARLRKPEAEGEWNWLNEPEKIDWGVLKTLKVNER